MPGGPQSDTVVVEGGQKMDVEDLLCVFVLLLRMYSGQLLTVCVVVRVSPGHLGSLTVLEFRSFV